MNVKKEAKNNYFKKIGPKLALSFSFLMIVFLSLATILLNPFIFILLFPFLITPALYAFQLMNLGLNSGVSLTNKTFFSFFRRSFAPQTRSIYRTLSAFGKALLVWLLSLFVVTLISSQILINRDPGFVDILNDIASLERLDSLDEIMFLIESNKSFYYLSTAITLTSVFAFFLAFLHFILKGAITVFLTPFFPQYFGKHLNKITMLVLKIVKPQYNRDYYRAIWLGPILLLLGFIGGFLATFFLTNNITYILLASISMSILFLAPFLPYYFDVLEKLFAKYQDFLLNQISGKPQDSLQKDDDVDQKDKADEE
ncbi:MAG: hypothetical protein WCZ47_04730 [Bacilli bacterium]